MVYVPWKLCVFVMTCTQACKKPLLCVYVELFICKSVYVQVFKYIRVSFLLCIWKSELLYIHILSKSIILILV